MERCDVLIVGGGPAGSSLAWRLAAQGREVVVLDKKHFPRDKVCAGWITPAVVETLQLDLDDYACGRTLQPIHRFRTGLIGGDEVLTDYGTTVSYGIRRREFDDYLLRRSGARLVLGEGLDSVEREGGEWIVNGRLRTPLLIGAGGHYCPVARRLGAALGPEEGPVTAQEVEFELSPPQAAACTVAPDTPELFFTPELDGYGWVFRKGGVLNIGLGREVGGKLGDSVAAFTEWLKARGKIPADIPQRFHGHAYLFYPQRRPRRVVDDGVLLIGDAAGLAYPQSGEGIRPAVESALLAAEVIAAADGDYRAECLAPYAERLSARFGPRQAAPAALPWLPAAMKRFFAGRLLGSPLFTRHVVLDRWFLHRTQPALRAG
ncbi:NAD(P)/FAD-dependent oxidoreductase [Sulfurivermis fontis]|uniref:NAD(P)/FAD-dependent oxidoreductase n=1 Tax=Sulfurivermis fontis TaxID=1972068 RepID=UPI000FDC7AED|nr:NAD(P)/FAD-dependent oxidoreductase [Sulfurivermis fontis]